MMPTQRLRDEIPDDEAWARAVDSMRSAARDDEHEPVIAVLDIALVGGNDDRRGNRDVEKNLGQALKRIGARDEDRARWLLRFSALDSSSVSQGERLDLSWEI